MLDSTALNFKDMRRGRKISLLLSKAKLPRNVCSRCSSGVATADLLLPGGCVFPHSKRCYLKLTDVRTERCFCLSPPLPVNKQLFVAGGALHALQRGFHVRRQNSEKFILFLFSSPRIVLSTGKSMKLWVNETERPLKGILDLICITFLFLFLY